LKLYVFPVAPNPTRVRLFLAEKIADGASIDVEEVVVNLREGEQKGPEHLARNAFGKLPVLELDDGTLLLESLPIIEYLEEIYPEPCLVGRDAAERARVRSLERVAELGVLRAVAGIVHATNSPLGLPPDPAVADYFRQQMPASLQYLDERLGDGRSFVAGDVPTIADCTLQAAMQFGRFGQVEIDPQCRNLARWDREFRDRPSARSVLVF